MNGCYRKGFGDGIKDAFIGKCIRGILLPWARFTEKIKTLVLSKLTNFGKSKQTLMFGPINSEFVIFKLFIYIYIYILPKVCVLLHQL